MAAFAFSFLRSVLSRTIPPAVAVIAVPFALAESAVFGSPTVSVATSSAGVGSSCRIAAIEREIEGYLAEADHKKEVEPLDKAMERLERFFQAERKGESGLMSPDARRFLLASWLRLYAAVTGLIDPSYTEESQFQDHGRIPAGFPSAYLFPYVQTGARGLRYKLRLDLLRTLPALYNAPDEARTDIRDVAERIGLDAEATAWLLRCAATVGQKKTLDAVIPQQSAPERRRARAQAALARLAAWEGSFDPLFFEMTACMNQFPPAGDSRGLVIGGMDPESIEDDEARRQYKVARRESERVATSAMRHRNWVECVYRERQRIYEELTAAYRNDPAGQEELMSMALVSGVTGNTLSDLLTCWRRDSVESAMEEFEKTGDPAFARKALALLDLLPDRADKRDDFCFAYGAWDIKNMRDFKLRCRLMILYELGQKNEPERASLRRSIERFLLDESQVEKTGYSSLMRAAACYGAPASLIQGWEKTRRRSRSYRLRRAEKFVAEWNALGGDAAFETADREIELLSDLSDCESRAEQNEVTRLKVRFLATCRKWKKEEPSTYSFENLKASNGSKPAEREFFLNLLTEHECFAAEVAVMRRERVWEKISEDIDRLPESGDAEAIEAAIDRLPVMEELRTPHRRLTPYIELLEKLERSSCSQPWQAARLRSKIVRDVFQEGKVQPTYFDLRDLAGHAAKTSAHAELVALVEKKTQELIARWEQLLEAWRKAPSLDRIGAIEQAGYMPVRFVIRDLSGDRRDRLARLQIRWIVSLKNLVTLGKERLNLRRTVAFPGSRQPNRLLLNLCDRANLVVVLSSHEESACEEFYGLACEFYRGENARRLFRIMREERADAELVAEVEKRLAE